MNKINLLKVSVRALANNKMRAFLTMLGVIIGVASVITMLAIGEGSKISIEQQISEMGSNMIMIKPGEDSRGGVMRDAASMQTLKIEDYTYLRENAKLLSNVSPMLSTSGQYVYGANNYPSSMTGVSPDYLPIRQLNLSEGSMFTETDIRTSAKVCVIGKTIKDKLFPNGENPVGKIIRFKKIPFRVIGVLKEKGYNTMGMDQDEIVIAPYSTIMKRVMAVTHLSQIYTSAVDEEQTEQAMAEITSLLRFTHELEGDDKDDFSIRSQQELSTMISSTSNMMTILLACVASISLLVGGIGIMNIMYVSVTERTKEIGLRMSIGAREKDILNQFLIEAILISVTGGVIGVIFGLSFSFLVYTFAQWPVFVESWTIVLSFTVCSFIGVFFGWYPAQKAARLNPIDAIRYE